MSKYPRWTPEELDYLEENWGAVNRVTIANKIGRSYNAVLQKAQRLGLGDSLKHMNGITISELSKITNIHYGLWKNWIIKYDFPAKTKRLTKEKNVLMVTYEDFWKWSESNKQMVDFSRIERLQLGPEPDWVEEKRKADQITKLHVPKPHNTPWSKADDAELKWMLSQHRFTYPEIAEAVKRSQGAIKRRIRDLGLKERPVRLYNHNKYTEEEVKKLVDMLERGYCFEEIAESLGEHRSSLGVRGKAERLGYKFKNGVPYLEDEEVI